MSSVIIGQSQLVSALASVNRPTKAICLGEIGIERDRLVEVSQRQLVPAQREVGDASAAVGSRVRRIQRGSPRCSPTSARSAILSDSNTSPRPAKPLASAG